MLEKNEEVTAPVGEPRIQEAKWTWHRIWRRYRFAIITVINLAVFFTIWEIVGRNNWVGPTVVFPSFTEMLEALRSTADRFANPDNGFGFGIARGEDAALWVPSTVDTQLPTARGRLEFLGSHPRGDGPPVLQLFMGDRGGVARLDLFDVRGRHVSRLIEENLVAGASRRVDWDGRDPLRY